MAGRKADSPDQVAAAGSRERFERRSGRSLDSNRAGFPSAKTGVYSNTFTLATGPFATLLAGTQAGKAYVNIHSPGLYAGGEIRGFLMPVPEPETYALMLAGLGLVGVAARRRSKV